MHPKSILTRSDYVDYLVYLYFGSDPDLLNACINRAYRDFNRTLHGFGRLKNGGEIYRLAVDVLKDGVLGLQNLPASQVSADGFDAWHKTTCERMISIYKNHGYRFFVGQAQKWVNMTMKYVFVLGEERLAGFEPVYAHCHVPLDNILLRQLERYGFPGLSCAWSRLDDYGEYLQRQSWIRAKFLLAPLDVEFLLWGGRAIPPEYVRTDLSKDIL
jgi:hypothetical protein